MSRYGRDRREESGQDERLCRLTRVPRMVARGLLVTLAFWATSAGSVRAQTPEIPADQPTPAQAGENPAPAADAPAQPSPIQLRDEEIRQVDLLAVDEKESKAKEKELSDAEKRRRESDAPLAGSIAATSEQNAAEKPGPRVVGDDEGDSPAGDYSGPAVLSRSYSLSRPQIPSQLKWQEGFGISTVFDSGLSRNINPDGSFGSVSSLTGTTMNWHFSGVHAFHHDVVSFNYMGSLTKYGGATPYSGGNHTASLSVRHIVSRRLSLDLSGTGSILSTSYALENQNAGPETIANVNLATSPNVLSTDQGAKQFSTQGGLTWQQSSRLSFTLGGSFFGIVRDSPLLLGMSGQQARGEMNYRFSRKMTIGSYYSYSRYLYPHGFGNSGSNTVGGIFSYAIDRSTQVRLRAGISLIQSLSQIQVAINPIFASLLGVGFGVLDDYSSSKTSDISAELIRDFHRGSTVSIAYAQGISPGNGLIQTATQQSISGNYSTKVFRTYALRVSLNKLTLSSPLYPDGTYRTQTASIALSRTLPRGVGVSLGFDYRRYSLDTPGLVPNEFRITSGMTWGSTRLWPF